MLIKEFAVAASVFALTACAGAQADQGKANHKEADQQDHYAFVLDGHGFDFSSSQMSHEEQLDLRREINDEVRKALTEARLEISLALAETKGELASLSIDADFDEEDLGDTIMMSVQTALQEAQRGLEEAELRLARDEDRLTRQAEHAARQAEHMARQAEHMTRQAEHLNRKAAEMKIKAEAMTREAERMKRKEARFREDAPKAPAAAQSPKAPKAPKAPKSDNSTSAVLAPAADKPYPLYRKAMAPYIH